MRQSLRRAGLAATLTAVLVLAACGDDDNPDDAVAEPTPTPAATAAVVGAGPDVPAASGAPTASATPSTSAVPSTSAAPSASAAATKTTKPKPTPVPKPTLQVAMPDGRTTPLPTDFSFSNLKMQPYAGAPIVTVDVTYKGPGIADTTFTASITYETKDSGRKTADYVGTISALQAGQTKNLRLAGGDPTATVDTKKPYSATYKVTSVQDGDPQGRVYE